jgi:ribosomal protein S18 acetylase RimI-like enzyme
VELDRPDAGRADRPRFDLVTEVTDSDAVQLWPVYDAVFGDQPDLATWREEVWDRHVARSGFRLARARVDGRVLGFGYGYTGEPGQWWTDHVAQRLDPAVAAEWLGGHFELVSIGVLAEGRGRGLGAGLLRTLTDGLPHERWVLTTSADADDPARHLYAREGWKVIGPGLRDDQVTLAKRRPTGS